jgi:hypothetical protein
MLCDLFDRWERVWHEGQYDHTFEGNRAWFRFTLKWTDSSAGETRTRAGMQVYQIESGKLAETWLMFQPLGSAWTDAIAQERWTSPPPCPAGGQQCTR